MLKHDLLDDRYCKAMSFAVTDPDALAHTIALVLVQEYALARRILKGDATTDEGDAMVLDADEIDDIVARRLKPPVVYHRDGFLFQLIMWLAAHLDLVFSCVIHM